jgi:sterol desaturase/sphingolipid hydroxylase (fatty acid hydroxylase superfamily)
MHNELPTDLIGIATSHAHIIFAFDFGRYLIAASLIAGLVWLLRRSPIRDRKIQKREASMSDVRREMLGSVQTCLVYVVVGIFVAWGVRNGILQRHMESVSWTTDFVTLGAMLVVHDAYFYWAHRTMHHPRLFKTFHRFHHRSITPTPFAAYAFAVPEAFVMAVFMPVWLFFVPTSVWVIVAFLNIMILRNAMGHAGFELQPRWWLSTRVTSWINTTTHHDLHHSGNFQKNYGLYFTWWDKMMGTEHPDYHATFARVVGRKAAAAPAGLAPSPTL